MARSNAGDQPSSQPLSPFHTPPGGMPMPVAAASTPAGSAGPSPQAVRAGPTPLGLLNALKRRWVMAAFIGGLVAVAVATAVWFAMPAGKHQARASIQIRSAGPDIAPRGNEDIESFRRDQIFILKTRDLINRTLAEPAIGQLETVRTAEDPIRFLEEGVKVEVASPSTLSVILSGDNIEDLKLIVDTLVKKYIEDASSYERTTRDVRGKKLEALATKFKDEIQAKEKQIRLMAEANGTSGADGAEAKNARMQQELAQLQAEAFVTQKQVQDMEVNIKLLKDKLAAKRFDINAVELAQFIDMDFRVAPLVKQKHEKEFLLDKEKGKAPPGEDPPAIKNLKEQIEQLTKEVTEKRALVKPEIEAAIKTSAEQQLMNRVADLEDKLEATKAMMLFRQAYYDNFSKQIGQVARAGFDVQSLLRDLDPQREYLHKIEAQLVQLRVERDMEDRVKIRENAVGLPNQNQKQKTLMAVAGALVGFLGVLVLIGYLEWRTRRIDGVDQVVTELGMRVIGTVPAFPTKANLKAAEAAGNANWRFVLNESINSTRTMLLHTARHQSMQVVMVTSATQGEGKTSLASQLASSMATAGMRTLIVDCDLRNPSIHKLFDLGLTAGVSEVLCQEADVSEAVQPTAVPNLWIIPAGQCSNRVITALAQGHPLETLFNRLRGQFDFIIVDSCPVLPVADALLIGQHVDGVLFSIMQDISQLPKVLVASEKLALLNIPLVGAVVNGIRSQDMYSYGYNYVKQLPA